MYEYKYVTVEMKGVFKYELEKHRYIINKHANKGYRFMGCIPIKQVGHGWVTRIDLVFEKPKQQNDN
ncbi:MAG: DUF4177 domain-containing protein [Defluviitaleaceae bacterium]|nr:DUF4177 domain-containing protein [Defluviitaleaceae bacterium]